MQVCWVPEFDNLRSLVIVIGEVYKVLESCRKSQGKKS